VTTDRPAEYLVGLVRELCKLPRETEWVEFKENDGEPEAIGEYLSALANSAALAGKAFAYLVWGVRDEDHAVVGTSFSPIARKVGNEELENWLLRQLAPKIHFRFFAVTVDGLPVLLLEVERAFRQPVQFKGQEFIRVGTYKKRLKDFPEKERALWRLFDTAPFESGIASERQGDEAVLKLLDYPAYFDLLEKPLPDNRAGILAALEDDKLIAPCPAGGWDVTNLGAILFAKKLDDFPTLKRKAMRVIRYKGDSRVETLREHVAARGYASGFSALLEGIDAQLPASEVIGLALRRSMPMFPPLAVRELVANALIHQDFSIIGSGPMVEIFDSRIEITNPGEPLVDTGRFVDTPPKSRNDGLASLMRRFRICEERGSGIDKVIAEVEQHQLPAPLFEVPEGFMRAVLFAHRPLSKMDKADRIRAVYLHACLRYVNREELNNASVRERFGIEPANKAIASRLIKEALDAGQIRLVNENVADKLRAYVPHWA